MRKHYVDQNLLDFVRFYCDVTNEPHLPTLEAVLIGRKDPDEMVAECDDAIAKLLKSYKSNTGFKMYEIIERITDKLFIEIPVSTAEVLKKIEDMIEVISIDGKVDPKNCRKDLECGKMTIYQLINLYNSCK